MSKYVALLRGVNVGGHNMLKISDLQKLFIEFGCTDVTTYLQTGNVLFRPGKERLAAGEIEAAIAQSLGVTIRVLLRSGKEMAEVRTSSPFARWEGDPAQLYVAFLSLEPDAQRSAAFSVPALGTERFWIDGRQVYVHYPDGYGRTKLTSGYIEQRLGVVATTRNWRVTNQLAVLLNA